MKNLRRFLYFCVGFVLALVVELSYAETIGATPSTSSKAFYYSDSYPSVTSDSGGQAFCTYLGTQLSGKTLTLQNSGCMETSPQSGMWRGTIAVGSCYYGYDSANHRCRDLLTYSCPPAQNWTLSGSTCTRPDCVLPETRVEATGLCAVPPPTCIGAQFLDEASNTCKCIVTQPTTKSYISMGTSPQDPPTCSNGCTQASGGAWGLPMIVCSLNFSGMTNVATQNKTCYAQTYQTGGICSSSGSGTGLPLQITLSPITAPAAPAGTSPSGAGDPLSTSKNNGDPITCGASGGNWGVFNGQGSCYSPTKVDPVLTQTKTPSVVVDPSGKSSTTTTITTQTCTGVGSCSSSITTTVGGGGGAGGTTVTSSGQGASGSANITSDGQGNFKIDLPKDYQRDSTGLILNAKVDELLDTLGDLSTDDSNITGAKATDASQKSLTDADKSILDAIKGQDPSEVTTSVNVWTQIMSTSWYEPIPNSTCSAFTSKIGAWSWTLDICPTAAKISEIGAYVSWMLLMFAGFRLVTSPKSSEV